MRRAIKQACKDNGVKTWKPYQVRHSVGTSIATKLGSLADAELVLGHSTGKVTERYVHNLVERTKDVVRRWRAA